MYFHGRNERTRDKNRTALNKESQQKHLSIQKMIWEHRIPRVGKAECAMGRGLKGVWNMRGGKKKGLFAQIRSDFALGSLWWKNKQANKLCLMQNKLK